MGTSKARWKTGRRSTWSRRTGAPNSSRTPEVFVPLDSDCLASVARQVNAGLTVALDRGVSTDSLRMAFTRDTIVRGDVRVTSDGDASGRPKGFFLGRSYLPLGDWKAGWRGGVHGAIALEPRTTGRLQPGGRFWASWPELATSPRRRPLSPATWWSPTRTVLPRPRARAGTASLSSSTKRGCRDRALPALRAV